MTPDNYPVAVRVSALTDAEGVRISLSMNLSLVEVVATSFTERSLDEVDPWSGDQNPWAHAALLRSPFARLLMAMA